MAVTTWGAALVAWVAAIARGIKVRAFMVLRGDTDARSAGRFQSAALFFPKSNGLA
jgi:hypothetical protein